MDRRFTELNKIGLVVNPAAGKDIRRLIAYGSVFGNQEKVNYTLRLLRGIESVVSEPVEVMYMPDPYDLVGSVEDDFPSGKIIFHRAPIPVFGDEVDTLNFTDWAVNEEKVDALVVAGGDGANRLVAKKSALTPLFSLFGGTNNVFAENIEPTVMGLAVGFFLENYSLREKVVKKSKILRARSKEAGKEELALVDVVVVEKTSVGARAVWEPELVRLIVVTQSSPLKIGLSSVVGRLISISPEEERGAVVELGEGGEMVKAPIAPGLVEEIKIRRWEFLPLGASISLPCQRGVLALDGEREIILREGENWEIRLEDTGPRRVDVEKLMSLVQERSVING